jgi:hypothetical protein
VAHTPGLSLTVPAQWSYSTSLVKREDVWDVVTAGTQGSTANRGTWISLSSVKSSYPVPSDNEIIEGLQRFGRSLTFKGPVPNTDRDHVQKMILHGQTWFIREVEGEREGHTFYGSAFRRAKTYSIFARTDDTHVDEMRKLIASIHIR